MALKLTAAQMDAAKTKRGGWSKKQLAQWGVSWPPIRGWRQALLAGKPVPQPDLNPRPLPRDRHQVPFRFESMREPVIDGGAAVAHMRSIAGEGK